MGQSIWESMEKKGYNRRQFLQFCTAAAAAAGFAKSGVAQVVSAFEKKEKPAVVWMHFQECTCCSESFIRASHPIVADALLDVLSLNYSETLMAASGFQAEKSLQDTIKNNKGKYIVLVEGAVPTKDGGVYCMIGGKTAESISCLLLESKVGRFDEMGGSSNLDLFFADGEKIRGEAERETARKWEGILYTILMEINIPQVLNNAAEPSFRRAKTATFYI